MEEEVLDHVIEYVVLRNQYAQRRVGVQERKIIQKKASWRSKDHGCQVEGISHSKPSWNGNLKANWDKSVTRGLSHRSILNLDKSDGPFSLQIAEACDILGIDLKEPSTYLLSDVEQVQDTSIYGPQEECTLRWLLKNLQSVELQPARQVLAPY